MSKEFPGVHFRLRGKQTSQSNHLWSGKICVPYRGVGKRNRSGTCNFHSELNQRPLLQAKSLHEKGNHNVWVVTSDLAQQSMAYGLGATVWSCGLLIQEVGCITPFVHLSVLYRNNSYSTSREQEYVLQKSRCVEGNCVQVTCCSSSRWGAFTPF